MASTYLTKTFSSGGNQRIWTLSFWVKLNRGSGDDSYIISYAQSSGSNPRGSMEFRSDANGNTFRVGFNPTGSSWTNCDVDNRKFRDYSAWYHIVIAVDTTQATASNRVKIYVNGEQQTVSTQPSQNFDTGFNHTHQTSYGRYENSDSSYLDGLLSHIHFIDGTQYQASDFGSTDSTTGEWKINTSPSVTYGTNGYFILKDGNSVTDQSGNSNNFTAYGTLTNTEDNPSNNFATWNANKKLTITLSNGNTTTSGNGDNGVWGTIGESSGKWYWETQQNANSVMMGIVNEDLTQTTGRADQVGVYGLQSGNGSYAYYRNNGSSGNSSGFPEITNSNVLCHALDLDNGKYFLGIDGVFKNLSGTTSNVATGADPTFTGLDTTKLWFPFTESRGTGVGCDVNFGNGYFGTTAISSEGTNASGIGKFEYDVPAGYTALSTKGLNE